MFEDFKGLKYFPKLRETEQLDKVWMRNLDKLKKYYKGLIHAYRMFYAVIEPYGEATIGKFAKFVSDMMETKLPVTNKQLHEKLSRGGFIYLLH